MNEKRSDGSTPTGSVVPPAAINDEMVEIAARALREATVQGRESWSISTWKDYEDPARAVVAAVVPYIEAGLREQIAAEIIDEWEKHHARSMPPADWMGAARNQGASFAFRDAARVARGTPGETPNG